MAQYHSGNFNIEAYKHLQGLPIPVRFAGFETTTLKLASQGWDISMSQVTTYMREYCLQAVFRFGGKARNYGALSNSELAPDYGCHRLYAVTAPLMIDSYEFYHAMQSGGRNLDHYYLGRMMKFGFDIQYMANDVQFIRAPAPRYMEARDFQAVDPFPSERTETIDVKNFKFFRVHQEETKELIVDPAKVPDLLDLILKQQKPLQSEIRKREQSRERIKKYESGAIEKPAVVHAQLISLAG